ncbi:MAG: large subunit ribosomal protein L6 [Parcubacteria group bacterium Greene0714_21]|nr:MAG: large subunit ribosomal protein L6 [Parcubacteria group bacterium Greene0714_21]
MSRIGRKPIEIPEGVKVLIQGQRIVVEGVKGKLEKEVHPDLVLSQEGNKLFLLPRETGELLKTTRSVWGTFRQIIFNMIEGVTKGFEKKLIIEGVGYRAAVSGDKFTAEVGHTNPSELKIPEGVQVTVEKSIISVKGQDKEIVGQFAASVRAFREVEPYKGKGIKYDKEVVKRKLGKRAATTTAGA